LLQLFSGQTWCCFRLAKLKIIGGNVPSWKKTGVAPDCLAPARLNPNYAIGGAMSSELPARRQAGLLALVGLTPIRESLFECGEANGKRLILFIEYARSGAYCIFWVNL